MNRERSAAPGLRFACATLAICLTVVVCRADNSSAASNTSALTSDVTVITRCSIATNPLNFGSYDSVRANATAPLDQTTTVNVACPRGSTGVTIAITPGDHSAQGGVGGRAMQSSGGAYLGYDLYQDPAHTVPWGDSMGRRYALSPPKSKDPQAITVYGRIPGGQDVPATTFSDVVLAIIYF